MWITDKELFYLNFRRNEGSANRQVPILCIPSRVRLYTLQNAKPNVHCE